MITSAQKMMMARAGVSAGVSAGGPWDVSNAVFNGTPAFGRYTVSGYESAPQGIFFKPDGTKMYVTGSSGDDINEFSLSTAWDVTTASFVQVFSVSAQDGSPTGIAFKPDGTKMYIIGANGDSVHEYNLSTAWNVSTASYSQTFSAAAQDSSQHGLFFKDDGTKMYTVGDTNNRVYEYTISTAWDISTASYVQSFSVAAQDTTPRDLSFKSDGTKMYVIGDIYDNVVEYDLSTAWDISTAAYNQSFNVRSTSETAPTGIFFRSDGTRMYMIGTLRDTVYVFNLSTAWDLSTAAYVVPTTDYFYVGTQEGIAQGFVFKPDGTKMYVTGSASDAVHEYDLITDWDISTAFYAQSFSVAAQDTAPTDVFFKPDGTKMYVLGLGGLDINEYALSTAWDVSTASYVQTFYVGSQELSPQSVSFKDDGTKMYILGDYGNDVTEYNLGVAWDISTASYLQVFSVSAQELTPYGLFFKPDGTKMYIVGLATDTVYQYNLSTAWDTSTASYVQSFSVAAQEGSPTGIAFKDDGTKMYVLGYNEDAIFSYDLL